MKKSKEYWISKLKLNSHPEGGNFIETYRSSLNSGEIDGFIGLRDFSTGIYFLIDADNFSAFHRIKSDEMWHFYEGDPLVVHMIDLDGNYKSQEIGLDLEKGQLPQFVVPAGYWFASEVAEGGDYSFVGCTVSPGFDFRDFELGDLEDLLSRFPKHAKILNRLCRNISESNL